MRESLSGVPKRGQHVGCLQHSRVWGSWQSAGVMSCGILLMRSGQSLFLPNELTVECYVDDPLSWRAGTVPTVGTSSQSCCYEGKRWAFRSLETKSTSATRWIGAGQMSQSWTALLSRRPCLTSSLWAGGGGSRDLAASYCRLEALEEIRRSLLLGRGRCP